MTPRLRHLSPAASTSQPVALITGAARGIGKSIASTFARAGYTVAICDINRQGAQACVLELRALGCSAEAFPADLSHQKAAMEVVEKVRSRYGRLDVLINNARAARSPARSRESASAWNKELSVTLRAASSTSRAAIAAMARGTGGSIVNIGSIAAFTVTPDSLAYQVAKAGMLQLTRCLAVEGGPCRVRVNAVLPGFIVQDEHRDRFNHPTNKRYKTIAEFSHPLHAVGSSSDVADVVLFLASDSSRFVTGQSLVVDGGLTLQDPSALLHRFVFRAPRR